MHVRCQSGWIIWQACLSTLSPWLLRPLLLTLLVYEYEMKQQQPAERGSRTVIRGNLKSGLNGWHLPLTLPHRASSSRPSSGAQSPETWTRQVLPELDCHQITFKPLKMVAPLKFNEKATWNKLSSLDHTFVFYISALKGALVSQVY